MALIWSVTISKAHIYLFPHYQSGLPNQYQIADEILLTLDKYFTTGYKTEEFWEKFDKMEMGKGKDQYRKPISPHEMFMQFSGHFKSLTIL